MPEVFSLDQSPLWWANFYSFSLSYNASPIFIYYNIVSILNFLLDNSCVLSLSKSYATIFFIKPHCFMNFLKNVWSFLLEAHQWESSDSWTEGGPCRAHLRLLLPRHLKMFLSTQGHLPRNSLSDFSGLSGYMDSSIKAELMLQILRRDLVLFSQWQFSGRIIFFVTPCACICVSRPPLLWWHHLLVWGSPNMFYNLGRLWIFSALGSRRPWKKKSWVLS